MKPGDRVRLTGGHTGYLVKIEDGIAWVAGQCAQVPVADLSIEDGGDSDEQYCDRCAGPLDTSGLSTRDPMLFAGGAGGS